MPKPNAMEPATPWKHSLFTRALRWHPAGSGGRITRSRGRSERLRSVATGGAGDCGGRNGSGLGYRISWTDSRVKMVEDVDEAMAHIARYGSDHTESIVTENEATADRFLREVDSGSVMLTTLPLASPMASSTGWVRRSASQPASSMPEVPSVLRVSPRESTSCEGTAIFASDLSSDA